MMANEQKFLNEAMKKMYIANFFIYNVILF